MGTVRIIKHEAIPGCKCSLCQSDANEKGADTLARAGLSGVSVLWRWEVFPMGFLARLFGRNPIREFSPERLGWTTEVVGELHYQAEIERQYRLHGGAEDDAKATATLIPEDDNEYDANAVRVEIGGRLVGYLSREHAAEYRSAVGRAFGRCGAKIVGGFLLDEDEREDEGRERACFGVKLNIAWPPRFRL